MTLYQGRDISASLDWLLIVRKNPLWSRLPKDLIRHLLHYFVFSVEQCWCGRFWKREVETEVYCSFHCYSKVCYLEACSFPIENGAKHWFVRNGVAPCCCCCDKSLILDYYEEPRNDFYYCLPCWLKEQRNGLFLEKKK